MINYSIIIPHKNIPMLLQRCLDSIPRRMDVQIIIVDDSSDSNVVDFDNFPGRNDPKVEVVFSPNENGRKGAGYARNIGMERALGKWLIFADADDFFTPQFGEILDQFKNDRHDMIYFGIENVDSDTLQPISRRQYIIDILIQAQVSGDLNYLYGLSQAWGKLLKREFVENNQLLFSETPCSEDTMFTAKSITAAKDNILMCLDMCLYVYTDRKGSLSKTDNMTDKFIFTLLPIQKEVVFYLKTLGKHSYRQANILRKWDSLYRGRRWMALRLLPHVAELYGWRFVFSEIIKKKILSRTP